MSKTAAVQAIYKAFAEGRIGDIIAQTTSDVIWVEPGSGASPWAGTFLGHDRVNAFFANLAARVDVKSFEPRQFIESGDTVVALGHWDAVAKESGREIGSDWAMVWKFRGDKVCFHEAYMDTAAIGDAFPRTGPKH